MAYQALLAKQGLIGDELQTKEHICILIKDGIIEDILDQKEYQQLKQPGWEEIDLGDLTIMPGMFECHDHLALDARIPGHLGMMDKSECEHTLLALNGLKDDLMSGVTTARSLGDRYYIDVTLREKIKEGSVIGPDLLVSGIGMKGRHGHGFVGVPHSGVEEFRRTSRENMFRGVDVLKIFITPGGIVGKGEFIPYYISYDEIKTVVDEAHQLNLKTVAHCIGGHGLDLCLDAGVDVLEHLYNITPEQVKRVEESDVWVDLTSGIVLDPEREPMVPPSHAANTRKNREYSRTCLEQIVRSGKIRYTLGTDAYHSMLYKELEFTVDMGGTSIDAVKGVTVNAARMCGVEKTKGSLKKGLLADIIAVNENPLDNVSTLKDVPFVMKHGMIYKNK
ncbi:MAG: amidohydrolase family protein [Clostridiales bacterium]|nr:amidohydrolase family protein [Clostridiales bacterium]